MMSALAEPLKYFLHDQRMIAEHCGTIYIVEDGDLLECVKCGRKWDIHINVEVRER